MPARFSSSDLKWIAMVTMFVDHTAVAVLYWNDFMTNPYGKGIYIAMRLIGRMAFPLFAFLLVEGFLYTRDWKRYAKRLALAAVLSEIPYNLAANHTWSAPGEQNTVVLLLIGLLTLKGISTADSSSFGCVYPQVDRTIRIAAVLFAGLAAAGVSRADYGAGGLLLILVFYFFRGQPQRRMMAGGVVLLLLYGDGYALAAWIAFFFINRYNGEKGRSMGILPYVFYPAHLLILYAAGVLIHGLHF